MVPIGYRVSPARTTWSGGGLGSGGVRLVVYDVLGRVVATLVEGPVSAGEHTVHFDATGLASGVYIYRLQARPLSGGKAGDFIQTRKMLLVK